MERRSRNHTRTSRARRFAHDGDDDLTFAGPVIEVTQDDLLPGAQSHSSAGDRKTLRSAYERATQVRIAILVAPTCVVSVVCIRRSDLLKGTLEIGDAPGFKFQSGDTERGTGAGDVYDAYLNAASADDASDLGGNIQDMAAASG